MTGMMLPLGGAVSGSEGEVVDIYPAYIKGAFRIELDWDEVRSIVKYDPVSGRTLEKFDYITLYPAKHFVVPEDQLKKALDSIKGGTGGKA